MNDDFERFFALTNPLYWVCWLIAMIISPLERLYCKCRNAYKNYVWCKYGIKKCKTDHLKIVVQNLEQRTFFGLKINRRAKYEALKELRKRGAEPN